jgi:hypothetical protein
MKSYPIKELYEFTPDIGAVPSERDNPLTRNGSLNAAEFIDMRLSIQRSRVGIIFDIRQLPFEGSNTALLVLTGIGNAHWNNDWKQQPWTTRQGNWEPTTSLRAKLSSPPEIAQEVTAQGGWALDAPEALTTIPTESTAPQHIPKDHPIPEPTLIPEYTLTRTGIWDRLAISGLSAEMYVGHVDGMDGPPPAMRADADAAIIAGFPQWSSVMTVNEHYYYPEPKSDP